MSTYQTPGIILKKTDRGEADQLFSIYTLERGKITAIGRATKKISSKLNGHLQFFVVVQLMIAVGKRYDHVASVQIAKPFSGIIQDLKKVVMASFALELVEKLTHPEQADSRLFELLQEYLGAVNQFSFIESDGQSLRQDFVIKLLTLLGFAPPQDVADNEKKLNVFLHQHVDSELFSDKFLRRIRPLTV